MSINFSINPGSTVNKVFTVDEDVSGFTGTFYFGTYSKSVSCSGTLVTLQLGSAVTTDFTSSNSYYIELTNGSSTFRIQGFITLDSTFGVSLDNNSGAVVSPAIGISLASGGFLSGLMVGAGGTSQVSSGAIRSGNIASGQIGAFHIASGVLSNFSLTSGSVVSGSLGNAVVFSGNIASGQIGANHISAGVIPSAFSLTSGVVTSGHIASGQIGNNHLASGAVNPSHLASGIPKLTGPQLFNSGNTFRGLCVNGWDASPALPTGGRLRIQASDWINTNAVIELQANTTQAQIGHYNDNGVMGTYNRTVITNVSTAPIEIGPNDYSTSKVGIGLQGPSMSGKLNIQPNSGMIAISVRNSNHTKDFLQLANSSGAIAVSINCSGLITSQNNLCGTTTQTYCNLTGGDASDATNNTIFVDSSDDTLKFRNSNGDLFTIDITAV